MKSKRAKTHSVRFNLSVILAGCLLLVVGLGCESADSKDEPVRPVKNQQRTEKARLKAQISQLQGRNEDLEKQVKHLLELGPEIRIDDLYSIEKIVISRRSGLYDKNRDGRKEKLIVYIRPVDVDGDSVKVPATVRVRVLDLEEHGEEILLLERQFTHNELKKCWSGAFMTGYYRLIVDVDEKLAAKKLTLIADLTEYFTGKVHSAVRVIKP